MNHYKVVLVCAHMFGRNVSKVATAQQKANRLYNHPLAPHWTKMVNINNSSSTNSIVKDNLLHTTRSYSYPRFKFGWFYMALSCCGFLYLMQVWRGILEIILVRDSEVIMKAGLIDLKLYDLSYFNIPYL